MLSTNGAIMRLQLIILVLLKSSIPSATMIHFILSPFLLSFFNSLYKTFISLALASEQDKTAVIKKIKFLSSTSFALAAI
jgi:hypothetical protein